MIGDTKINRVGIDSRMYGMYILDQKFYSIKIQYFAI